MYKRIIGLVLLDNGYVCRTRNFISDYLYNDLFIDTKYFDEIAFIDVTKDRSSKSISLFASTIEKLMKNSQLPMAIGGGINNLNDIKVYRSLGADRYIINQSSPSKDAFVKEATEVFGQSTILSAIDHWGQNTFVAGQRTSVSLYSRLVETAENSGSEILINSVEHDGSLLGFDKNSLDKLADVISKPTLIAGGIGNFFHVLNGFKVENISGVMTSSIYHLTTSTVLNWRKQIIASGGKVRSI